MRKGVRVVVVGVEVSGARRRRIGGKICDFEIFLFLVDFIVYGDGYLMYDKDDIGMDGYY